MRFLAGDRVTGGGAGAVLATAPGPAGRAWRLAGGAGLATAACALALTGCGSQAAPAAIATTGRTPAPSATPSATASPSPSPSPSPSQGAATTACTTSQLKIAITNSGALGGQAGGYLKFTNDGAGACQLTGWPSVVALTSAGQGTTLKRAQSTMYGAWQAPAQLPTLKLGPGDSAYAVVAADDQPTGNGGCPAPYRQLRVTPPGSSASVTVTAYLPGAQTYLPACTSAAGAPTAEVSAITPLASLAH
jgi:hypothetical protein